MRTRPLINCCISSFLLFSYLQATSLDGTSTLKYQSTHYVLRDTNTVTGYARFANGFTILPATNHASSAILDTCLSCSGGFDLRETSTLKLIGDLTLDSTTTLTSGGKIYGYNRALKLNGNLTLNANKVLHLGGNLIIDGQGNDIFINEYAQFMLDNGATVTIQNATIHNKRNYQGRPALAITTTTARLTLADVELALDSDLYINSGQVFIHNDVAVTGTSALIWHSVGPCTIEPNATLYFDMGTTFSYAPPCTDKDLIRLTDQSSTLQLNGCSLLATHTGLRLTKGTVLFDNRITINSAACNKLNALTEKTNIDTGRIEENGVHWSPSGKYIAIGGELNGGKELAVYSFNGSSFTSVASYDLGTAVKPVRWSPDGKYIAVGGHAPTNNNELQVLSFDGTSLTLVDSADFDTTMVTVNWSPDGQFIVAGVGSAATVELKIYRFDGKKLIFVQGQEYGAAGSSILGTDWSPDGLYLALGGNAPTLFGGNANTNELQIYKFDRSILMPITSQDYGSSIYTCNWSPDGKFLAIGGNGPTNPSGGFSDTNELRIYSFNGTTLTAVTSQDYGDTIHKITWSPDGKYLAIGGYTPTNGAGGFNNTNELRIYSFDGTTLTPITSQDYGTNSVYYGSRVVAISWSPNQEYLAVGGNEPTDGNEFKLYTCNYLNETATQAVTNGIIFGSSSAGATHDPTVKVLADAQVTVNGILNLDAA